MKTNTFTREPKGKRPIIAICYDFDKTLSPTDMQAQGYIQSVNYDVQTFWQESNALADQNEMDQNLAYMLKMVQEAEGNLVFNRTALEEYGSKVKLFPGVEDWFSRINDYADKQNILVEHYIISSGLKEMIEGTAVAKQGVFKKVYASSFYYNDKGVAEWPAQVVNFTGKTQYLFRISKGVLDVNDPGVNDHFRPEEIRIPFRNIVYIGDSDTDIPCMKLVTSNGGHSIGVYDSESKDKSKVQKMIHDSRISYYAAADYRDGEELDCIVKAIIDRTAKNEQLIELQTKYEVETQKAYSNISVEDQKRRDMIWSLENSSSFTATHTIISKMRNIKDWKKEERENLYAIAINNNQVGWIITDRDVKAFYKHLLSYEKELSEHASKIKKLIET